MKIFYALFSFCWKLYCGIIFFITAILLYPFLAITSLNSSLHYLAFRGFSVWSYCYRIFTFTWVHYKKKAHYSTEPHIIIANHASFLDIFLLPSILAKHPFVFLGKSEVMTYPLIRTYFRKFNVPVNRKSKMKAARAMLATRKKLQEGWSVVIFPEGGIPDHERPKMLPFKNGAFQLAKSTNTPILPVTFTNNHRLFTDPTDLFGSCRPGLSHVHLHDAVSVEKIQELSTDALNQFCFSVVNAPLQETHSFLKEN